MHGISTVKVASSLWKWLPGFFLRRRFPPDRIAHDVHVEIRSRHDPFVVDLGMSAVMRLWLEVRNQSIFNAELDRACCLVQIGNQNISMIYLKRVSLPAGASILVDLHQTLHADQANLIAQHLVLNRFEQNDISIGGFIEFNCSLHPFTKSVGQLSGIRAKILNLEYRNGILK